MPMAVALCVISYTEAVSIGQSLDERNNEDTLNPNNELLALGASNLLGYFFQ
jgi:SulP family sulfate permease